jgi:predicted phage terminase large subunit-like protein
MNSLKKLSEAEEERKISRARRELARRRLDKFIEYTSGGDYIFGWVHRLVCSALDGFLDGITARHSPRLAIFMPPRHGKSEIVSRRFPAFAFGRNPDMSVIGASYSATLAARMNRDIQRIMDSEAYRAVFPGTALSGMNIRTVSGMALRNSEIFEIVNRGGSYRGAGVGGGITGMGCDCLIIDDAVKDRAEADSAVYRQKVFDWYTSTAYTRLSPGGGVVLIMTRWHTDDLAGRVLRGGGWDVLSFPAIAEKDEEYRRAGEALHPERYPLERLLEIKDVLPGRDWASLYQQRPVVDGGNIFRSEWLRYYGAVPGGFDFMCQSWDMTFDGTDGSDYVAGQVWGRRGADFYLLDQVHARLDFTGTIDAVINLTKKYPKAVAKLVEKKANGAAVINVLKSKISGLIPVIPTESKESRAHAVTPLWRAGNVWLPDPGREPWIGDFTGELLAFPAGAHDDQVDAMTQALSHMQNTAKPLSEETRAALFG